MREQANLPKITVKVVFISIWIFLSIHYWQVLGGYFQNPEWHLNYIYDVTVIESWFLLCILVATWITLSLTRDLDKIDG